MHRKSSLLLQLPHTLLLGLPPHCFSSANTDSGDWKPWETSCPYSLAQNTTMGWGVERGLCYTAGLHIQWFLQGLGFGKQYPVKAAHRPEKCIWSCPADPHCSMQLCKGISHTLSSTCHFCPAIWCTLADFTHFCPEASDFSVLHHRDSSLQHPQVF